MSPAPEKLTSEKHRPWYFDGAAGLFLVLMAIVVYLPALRGDFIWDDNDHISANTTLHSLQGLRDIWFRPGATCQYYPLTFTGFWVGYQFWGLNPLGYHLLNVLMHGVVAVLLWQLLTRLKMRGAWLAAAIFAVHPVCVMSVAWMTELKNTLSAALALAAALAWLRFARLGIYESNDRRDWRLYAVCLLLFQAALFAKTAVSFLPVSLLLITWWRREQLRWLDVRPLVPMLVLVGAMGWLTFHIEHLHGAVGQPFHMGLVERALVSGRVFWFYLAKLFVPVQLTFIYERWTLNTRDAAQYLYPLATLGLLSGLWCARRRFGKGLFVAMSHFYVCTSLLALLVVLYMTRYSFVSDHWQYFGCMSVIALVAFGITAGFDRLAAGRTLKPVLCGLLLLGLGVLTWRQCGMYANLETLWQTTLARNPRAFLAHNNLGELLAQRGQMDAASAHFRKAIEIQPDFAEAHYNLGNTLIHSGRKDEAMNHFRMALENLPDFAEAHNNLGNVLFEQGRVDEAIGHFQIALRIQPDFAEAHFNLGKATLEKGKTREALDRFEIALKIQPDNPDALALLAWVLATGPEASIRNGTRAIELAQRANDLFGGRDLFALQALAAAYAEGGRFEEAEKVCQSAMSLADPSNIGLREALRAQLRLYQARSPFRDTGLR